MGGVFRMKVNDPSVKMLISAGMISPAREAVRALYSLQKAIRLIPWPASAGPMGGAGLAFPASICRRTTTFSFFAKGFSLWY